MTGKTDCLANRDLFQVQKPEFTLVKGDRLTYRCQAHEALYPDLRIVYDDGYSTYETRGYDRQWRVRGTNQIRSLDLDVSAISQMRTTAIEVKTPPLQRSNPGQKLHCIAQSRRADVLPNKNDTYVIRVDGKCSIDRANGRPHRSG